MWWKCKITILRFYRRTKYAFVGRYRWEYESCGRCGHCYRIAYWLRDELWNKIIGKEAGCYCLDCITELAEKKHIYLKESDFDNIWYFIPETHGKYYQTEKEEIRDGKQGAD